jgi:hypothetical protein
VVSFRFHNRAVEWLFRTEALRRARALDPRPRASSNWPGAVQQAALQIEVARRVLEPAQPLPPGETGGIVLPIYRSAIEGLAVLAGSVSAAGPAADPWDTAPPAAIARAEPDPEARRRVQALLAAPAVVAGEDLLRVRRFAESLLREVAARPREVDLLMAQRWLRMLLVGLVLVLGAVGARAALARPDLAKGKRFWTSSSWADCPRDPPCSILMFHTDEQYDPWVEIDLGSPKVVRQIEVTNREDCCSERTIPLVAEISKDGSRWIEVGRRSKEFVSWTAKFRPTTARYVRLRVPRTTTFHLQSVAVR